MLIVNKRNHTPTPSDIYVGRPTALGNPFVIGRDGDRDRVVERYGRWLLHKIRSSDVDVMDALETLTDDSVLVCWCAPQRCHAEMIQRAWTWLWLQDTSGESDHTNCTCCPAFDYAF